jgi:hypothetical protein
MFIASAAKLRAKSAAIVLLSMVVFGRESIGACGDARDSLIAEYPAYTVDFTPSCDDFSDRKSSTHFSFLEMNHPEDNDYPTWAILSDSLFSGIEAIRTSSGQPLTINSGYRSPARNAATTGAATNSRHVHGDAADIATTSTSWDDLQHAGKTASACTEPKNLSYPGHVHVDWRGPCPTGW